MSAPGRMATGAARALDSDSGAGTSVAETRHTTETQTMTYHTESTIHLLSWYVAVASHGEGWLFIVSHIGRCILGFHAHA